MCLLGVALVFLVVLERQWLRLSLGQWVLVGLALAFVVRPVSTLLHELGHAAAAVWLGGRAAHVIVGRGPWTNLVVGRVRVSFSLLPTRGVRMSGLCRYDASGLPWRSLAWIALAGPAATLSVLVLLIALVPAAWSAGSFARVLIVLSAAAETVSLVVNLRMVTLQPGDDRAVITDYDGAKARRAFARHREGAPPPQLPLPTKAKALP
jgi:membrane-associated protease RseP (regulator of RpoE activity)